ncbi:zeta toxin family protein [Olivibacter jilunii]|uniref:zeta toxin family protein n=1 Tax=Olivibacter jilunii TaxID=985016 RepID=UPI003F16B5C1
MPKAKRLRVFAGPNGSGKSTLFEDINQQFDTGYFVNSDAIEKEISSTGFVNLENFGLSLTEKDLHSFFRKPNTQSLLEKSAAEGHKIDIQIKENVIVDRSRDTHSYEASLITSFIRKHLLEKGISYSFETVMSHISKLDEIQNAKDLGYKTYLYFVCLDDSQLNISRVQNRVEKGGHAVPKDKIITRYTRTLENLLPAVLLVQKAYLFDNSGQTMLLVAEVKDGQLTILVEEEKLPNWFIEYIVNKVK